MSRREKVISFWSYVYRRTLRSSWTLFRLMIPISIIIRFIQEAGWLPHISDLLAPVMRFVGLPAETALVWLSAMVVNIYGGLLALFAITPQLANPLTHAQLTVLLTMVLIAHTFPIELGISRKTGIKIWVMLLFRFCSAILAGWLLSTIYGLFGALQEPVTINKIFIATETTWGAWALNELKNYAIILLVIFCLVTFIHLLEVTGLIKWFNRMVRPALGWLGISDKMLPLTIVGLTLGIAYGGGLIVEEGKKVGIAPKEIFYSMLLMGLLHSVFEDTLLILSMGGHWSGVIVFRTLFAFAVTFLIIQITKHFQYQKFIHVVMTRSFRKRLQQKTTEL